MSNKDSSKPRELKPSIKRLIVDRAITRRQVPREFLANELIKEITEAGEIPPTLETAKRYISKARNTKNPKDKPWTLACCSNYPSFFPPESIPVIVDFKNSLSKIESESDTYYQKLYGKSVSDISIRCAIWIIRLKPLIEHISDKFIIEKEPLPTNFAMVIAMIYSMSELASEILGENEFDSSDLDQALFTGDLNTLFMHQLKSFVSTLTPTKCDDNCNSCKLGLIPIFKNPNNGAKACIPKLKECEK